MCPMENVTYEFILAALAMSRIFCSSYLDGFRGKWPYSGRHVGCCFQDLLILVQFPSSFVSMRFVYVDVVHP